MLQNLTNEYRKSLHLHRIKYEKNTVNAFGNEFAKLSFHVSLLHTNEHIHVS